jgi:hypothetical protein
MESGCELQKSHLCECHRPPYIATILCSFYNTKRIGELKGTYEKPAGGGFFVDFFQRPHETLTKLL